MPRAGDDPCRKARCGLLRGAYSWENAMPGPDQSERIDALETRIAFQDQTIEELNAALTEQWKSIDLLTKKLAMLEEQVRSGSFIADPATERPPPHY
jgi:SlyX protein